MKINEIIGESIERGVAEGFSNDMSTEDMIAYLKQHHDKNLHPDYLNHLTSTNSKFVLKNIPINSIRTELSGLDKAKVEQYKQMDFSKAPPIVVGSDGNILDGYHRANVAKALGISTIKAYVGVKGQQGMAEGDMSRRNFLKKSGVVGGALALGAAADLLTRGPSININGVEYKPASASRSERGAEVRTVKLKNGDVVRIWSLDRKGGHTGEKVIHLYRKVEEEGVKEATDKHGFHTSVSKGKFLPSKYGQDENNLYLHDLMNASGDGSGPQLVTVDDKRIATELAAIYGGYVERTGMGTYRVYQPKGMRQSAKQPELASMTEGEVVPLGKKHRGNLEDTHSCVKCGGDLQNGTYMGHKVKVCLPCKQVYLPPNSGIDQQGNKIDEAKRKRKRKAKRRSSSSNRSPVPRYYGAWGWGGEGEGDGGGE